MMDEENKIDRLFSQGLNAPEIPFNELDWEKMQAKLDKQDKKKILPLWLISASGIAAAIVIVLFWTLPGSNTKPNLKNPSSTVHNLTKPNPEAIVEPVPFSPKYSELVAKNHSLKKVFHHTSVIKSDIKQLMPNPAQSLIITTDSLMNKTFSLARANTNTLINPYKISTSEIEKIRKDIEKKADNGLGTSPALTMSIIAAPDISTTKLSRPSKLSSNFGLLATYAFNHRLSITSGAVYSKKLYNYEGISVNGAVNPANVDANCDVLDIPVNFNYKIFQKNKIAVSINAGASSYVMLKERYQLSYTDPAQWKNEKKVVINNENQYLFGVANIGVSINHKITSNLSIGIQPFMKLPLTGIGYGDTRLKSTGVSFSLNFGLFPGRK